MEQRPGEDQRRETERRADRRRAQSRSFGVAAAAYERGRPSYPAAALDWLLPPGARRVLDLGAGTGKLTRSLVQRGLDVVAVEPTEGMRAQFREVLPGVELVAGTAEEVPLPDASADAALAAQAWHWVDPQRAAPEVARVLRPGGTLGLLWNVRDAGVPWIARLDRMLPQAGEEHLRSMAPVVGPPFGPVERLDVTWTQVITLEELMDLTASRSWVITLEEPQRSAVLADVRTQAQERLDAVGVLEMAYVTRCSRTRRP
ncbi:methyltransferase domain-containing protein [Kineococcus sp. R8]|uniref:methyltransferase domain-containing protein n=1 Tax=Kineococcus siccus TaxID=2696567 RepID=UPI0014129803|nr:methyltransferase domain-containing protein [Kineococcus siccus]